MSTQENDLLYMRFLQEKGLMGYEREVTSETKPSKGSTEWSKKTTREPVDIGKEMGNRYLDFIRSKGIHVPGDPEADERGVYKTLGKREPEFQNWYKGWAAKAGLSPDPNPDLHFYDYRKAFLAGVQPEINPDDNRYHWSSKFKYRQEVEGVDHPNRWVEGVDTTESLPSKQEQAAFMKKEFAPTAPRMKLEKTGETVDAQGRVTPTFKFTRPPKVSPGTWRQALDILGVLAAEQRGLLPPDVTGKVVQRMVKDVTLDIVDIWKVAEMASGQVGLAKELEDRYVTATQVVGYDPNLGRIRFEETAGALAMFVPYVRIAKAARLYGESFIKAAPAARRFISAMFAGTVTGTAQIAAEKIAGEPFDLVKDLPKIPTHILYWTALQALGMTWEQIKNIVNWNLKYGGKPFGTGKRGGYGAAQGIEFETQYAPGRGPTTKANFTAEEIRDIYRRADPNYTGAGKVSADPGDWERQVYEGITGANGWREAVRRGWIPPRPVTVPGEPPIITGRTVRPTGTVPPYFETPIGDTGVPLRKSIPLKPEWGDVFRTTPRQYPAPEIVGAPPVTAGAPTVAAPVAGTAGGPLPGAGGTTEAPPRPSQAPPPGTTPPAVVAPPAAGTRPGAEPPPVTGIVPRPPIVTPPPRAAVPKAKPKIKVTPQDDGSFTVETVEPEIEYAPTPGKAKLAMKDKATGKVYPGTAGEQIHSDMMDRLAKAGVQDDNMIPGWIAPDGLWTTSLAKATPPPITEKPIITPPPESPYAGIPPRKPIEPEPPKEEIPRPAKAPVDEAKPYARKEDALREAIKRVQADEGTPEDVRLVLQVARRNERLKKVTEALKSRQRTDLLTGVGSDRALAKVRDWEKRPVILFDLAGVKAANNDPKRGYQWTDKNIFIPAGRVFRAFGDDRIYRRGGTADEFPLIGRPGQTLEDLTKDAELISQELDKTGVAHRFAPGNNFSEAEVGMAGLKDKARIEGVTSPVVPETLPELEKFIIPEGGEERLTMTGKSADAIAILTKGDDGYFRIQRTADKTFVKSPRTGFPDFPNRDAAWKAYLEERKGGGLRDASLAEPSQRFIKSLEPPEERARRILKSRREAQVKRGRVGMPKNPPKIWKDIMEITGGVGMRPMFTSTGTVAEEYLVNVPKFMKNKNGKPPDEIIDALERDYGYTFVEEDMWSLLSKARYETPGDYGDEGPVRPGHPDPEAIEAELARQKKEYAPLMKEGETLDAFLGRMAQDAAEDGFGTRPEDIDEYISQMLKNKKGGGEPEGGAPAEAVPFEIGEKPAGYKKAEPEEERVGDIFAIGEFDEKEAPGFIQKAMREAQKPKRMDRANIASEVYRLTSGDFFPKEWQGNTDIEIQDNRQNLFRFVWENYTPDKGPLENYINANKGFFIRGESGRKGLAKLKREQQFPKTVTGGEKDFGEDKSVFGPESQPKGKKPPEPEIPGDSMKPDVFGAEEIRVMNALRSTAQVYTKSLGEAPGFEDKAVDILKSRLLASTPESFRSIGERLGYSKSYVKKQYDAMLEILKDSPAIKEIMAKRMVYLNMGPLPSEQDLKHLAKMLRKYFSSYRGADKIIDQQNDRRIGGRMAEIFDQTIDASKINKWLRDQPEGTNEVLAQLMRGAMSGDGMEDIQNSALPADIKEAMLNTRQRVDRLSDLVITHGGLAEETRAAFENNIGKYLAKAYRLYQDKHWSPTDAQKDAFKRWLMNEYTMTPEQADEFIEAELAYGRNDEGIRPQRSRRTRRVPTEHFIRRKVLSPAWREFAGEIERLPWLAMHTITKQATMAYNAKFLDWISEYLPEHWTADYKEAAQRGWQNSQFPEHNYAYGKLSGKWVDPELHQYITKEFDMARSDMEEAIQKFIMNPFKWTKTIGSLPSHSRNFLSNFGFSMLLRNSILNPLNAKWYIKSLNVHLNNSGSARDVWSKLIAEGVTETQFYGAEIPRIHKDVMRFDPATWPEKIWDKFVAWPIDKLGELYNFGDSLYRVSSYLKNTAPKSEGGFGMTPTKAVEELNAGLQNYRKLPVVVDFLRRWPVLGPFISFKANTVKIIGKQAEMAVTEIKNPATRSRGISRWLRLALFLSIPAILSEISKKVFDVDEKQVKELERWYPEYRRNGTFLYFRGEGDKLKVFDFSFLWPTGDIERFGKSILRGDIAGAKDSLDFFSHPLFDIWSILIQGQDPQWGTKYRTIVDRAKAAATYLYLPASMPIPNLEGLLHGDVRPGNLTGPQIKAVIDAYNGQPDQYGRVKQLPEEIKNFFSGIRTWDVDPEKLLAQAAIQRSGQIRELQGEYARWLRKNTLAPQWERDAKQKAFVEAVEKISAELRDIGALGRELRAGGFKAKTQ